MLVIKVQVDTKAKTDHRIPPPLSNVLSLLHHVAWMIVRSASIFTLEHEIEPLKPIHYTLHTDVINTNPTPLWPLNIAHNSFPLSLSVWLAFRNPQSCTAERGLCVCVIFSRTQMVTEAFLFPFVLENPALTLLYSTPLHSGMDQTSPHPQPYVVLRLGPPGLLTDFCKALVKWKAWRGPCAGIWPCPPVADG